MVSGPVAIPAIDRPVITGLKRHHGLLAALHANCREHFTLTGLVAAVVSGLFSGSPAVRATLGFIVIAFFFEKSLFTLTENECRAAIFTC